MKNVGKLIGWFSIAALEQVRRNLDNPDSVTFVWREGRVREFKMIMQNANDCVNLIVKQLKRMGMVVNKNYEERKKSE
jgi:hypothetical protein